ncbi:MAG: type III restriction endonuclease subunit R [Elusimicrobiota bacterium]
MSTGYEVAEPILNKPFEEPLAHWFILEGAEPQVRDGRRPALVYPPREEGTPWNLADGTLIASKSYKPAYEMVLVNRIRARIESWRKQGYPGVSRITLELIQWWRREGRQTRLFFAQLEAAESIIFLREARKDFLQGIDIPADEPSEQQKAEGKTAFLRYACKMATGSGKTMVMGMLSAWSILNKINNRSDARFSDVVLVVCPNVTIRNRLQELNPANGESSIYRTRDLVPPHLMPGLVRGRVLVTNWHIFEPQTVQIGGAGAKVLKAGRPVRVREKIKIGQKTTTARGTRYLSGKDFSQQVAAGMLQVIEEKKDDSGNLKEVVVESMKYVESDTKLIQRVLGRRVGGKQNILIMNDEAHHAYRIHRPEADEGEENTFGDAKEADEFFKEATVWIDGLDRIHKHRGINFCVDLSATPFFLGRVGHDTNRPFPWVVSDFGLVDAIESGLVKIPQLAIRDTTGAEIPGYFNIWRWLMEKLTPAERGGKKASPKPEAVLKWAHTPLAMLGGLWDELREEWEKVETDDTRPPVFILVCKNTKIAKLMFEWIAEGNAPAGLPPAKIEGFQNKDGQINTIRVDTKVVHETDTGGAKSDEVQWMRVTLDTAGTAMWPTDRQGRPIYPQGFEVLAKKLKRPLHPPGRDIRCIVSVGMLTEGWDCNTVTHIIGLRPFMSQLLCEQVVGRGLRRKSYEIGEDGRFTEEVAKVLGVPFEVIPFKANATGPQPPRPKPNHIHAIPGKDRFSIEFPRVEGYTQAIRNHITVDWRNVPPVSLEPGKIPPEVEVAGLNINNKGRFSLSGPHKADLVTLQEFRAGRREQELVFDLAGDLTREYMAQGRYESPAHVLFPQVVQIVRRYLDEKVNVSPPADLKDIFLSPYYGWVIEKLRDAIRPDTEQGEAPEVPRYESSRGPGSTADVDFWTSRPVREVRNCHLNYAVADTKRWEQAAAYYIDTHPKIDAFVKNSGLGFSIPYFHNGQPHDYIPDFIIRLKKPKGHTLIIETKGFDELEKVKAAAAERWVAAVNADGSHGQWSYAVAKKPEKVRQIITEAAL